MMEDIERVHYLRDDQIPKTMCFRGIYKRFHLENVISGIVEIEEPSLVILDREKKFYLIIRNDSKDLISQIHELLKGVSLSMYMEVPLRKNESIDNEEEYRPDKSEVKEMRSLKEPEEKKE